MLILGTLSHRVFIISTDPADSSCSNGGNIVLAVWTAASAVGCLLFPLDH